MPRRQSNTLSSLPTRGVQSRGSRASSLHRADPFDSRRIRVSSAGCGQGVPARSSLRSSRLTDREPQPVLRSFIPLKCSAARWRSQGLTAPFRRRMIPRKESPRMIVYVCDCGCFHGWQEGAGVRLVTQHVRYPMEDVSWCPGCGREHRTNDGSMLGQPRKEWRLATEKELALIEKGVDPRANDSPGHRVIIDRDGNVVYGYGLW